MKRLAIAISFALLMTPALASADLTGKWSGSFIIATPDGGTKDDEAFMDLKQSGTELTGTAGPRPEKQWAIQKGKVEGNKITFEIQSDGPLVKFELTLVDEHLKGQATAEHEGRSLKATLDLQRAK